MTESHTVHVKRTPEAVFDYTQDYATRTDWDSSVTSAKVVSENPRRVEMAMRGIGPFVLEYKLFRRGGRTSAAFNGMRSRLFSGGGGSWSYEPADGGTDWAQTSTLEFKNRVVGFLMAPMVRWNMRRATIKSMNRAKEIMESTPTG